MAQVGRICCKLSEQTSIEMSMQVESPPRQNLGFICTMLILKCMGHTLSACAIKEKVNASFPIEEIANASFPHHHCA
jgi:hypothetical protein